MQVLSGAIPIIYRAHPSAVDEYPEYTVQVRLHKTHLFNLFVSNAFISLNVEIWRHAIR